jgi:hypothetical protein
MFFSQVQRDVWKKYANPWSDLVLGSQGKKPTCRDGDVSPKNVGRGW